MAVKRPDLFDVLEVVRERPGCQTCLYRNMLHSKGHRDFTTALVLARLRMLEHLGKVRLAGNSRFPPYAWDATADTTAPPTWVTKPVARKPVTTKQHPQRSPAMTHTDQPARAEGETKTTAITLEFDPSKLFDVVAEVGDGGAALGCRLVGIMLTGGQSSFREDVGLAFYGVSAAPAALAATRPDGGGKTVGQPDELTETEIRSRAAALISAKGWAPGETLHFKAVLDLMTEHGMAVASTPPQDRCAHPVCGCDADSVCGSVAATPSPAGGAVPDSLRAALVEALAQHFHDEEHQHEGYAWTWPEYADDDGRRGNSGYVSITPPVVQMECREAAERITRRFEQFLATHPAGQIKPYGWAYTWTNDDCAGGDVEQKFCRTEPDTTNPYISNIVPLFASYPASPLTCTEAECEESYKIGQRDGYDEGVQDAAIRAGLDGEYQASSDPDRHVPDASTMLERIAERVDGLEASLARATKPAPNSARTGQGEAPDGWVLVPERMDPIMIGAFWRWKNTGSDVPGEFGDDRSDAAAYRAMIAARPAAPEAQGAWMRKAADEIDKIADLWSGDGRAYGKTLAAVFRAHADRQEPGGANSSGQEGKR